AETADQFVFRVEALALDAVFALVARFEDNAFIPKRFQKSLHGACVLRRSGSDKGVVGDLQTFPGFLELSGDFIAVTLWILVVSGSGLGNFGPMLNGAGEKKNLQAVATVPARQNIAGDGRIRVSDVRHIVHVVDRCGNKKLVHVSGVRVLY